MAAKNKTINEDLKRDMIRDSIFILKVILVGVFIVLFAKAIIGGTLVDLAALL